MGPNLRARAFVGGALFVAVAACNAVLDNHPGVLDERSVDGTEPSPGSDRKSPPNGTATATGEAGHDASTDPSPTIPEAAPPSTPTCPSGFADCNTNANDGCEANLTTSVASCGACGAVCPLVEAENTVPACESGVCVRVCLPSFGDCNGKPADGCEANLAKDKRHCGQCGLRCLFGKCTEGKCTL